MIRPLYKAEEPFMEVPVGHGFQGVMMYDDKDDKVQCHLCGKWYSFLAPHLSSTHKLTSIDYKLEFGLPMNIGLCSQEFSRKKSVYALRMIEDLKPGFGDHAGKKLPAGFHKRRNYVRKQRKVYPAYQNKFGLCALQMKSRYEVVAEIVKRSPTKADIEQYDPKLERAMYRNYGGINGFKKAHGIPQRFKQTGHSEIAIAAFIRKLSHDLHRKPKSIDVKAGADISRQTIYNKFGSWEAALQYSGLK